MFADLLSNAFQGNARSVSPPARAGATPVKPLEEFGAVLAAVSDLSTEGASIGPRSVSVDAGLPVAVGEAAGPGHPEELRTNMQGDTPVPPGPQHRAGSPAGRGAVGVARALAAEVSSAPSPDSAAEAAPKPPYGPSSLVHAARHGPVSRPEPAQRPVHTEEFGTRPRSPQAQASVGAIDPVSDPASGAPLLSGTSRLSPDPLPEPLPAHVLPADGFPTVAGSRTGEPGATSPHVPPGRRRVPVSAETDAAHARPVVKSPLQKAEPQRMQTGVTEQAGPAFLGPPVAGRSSGSGPGLAPTGPVEFVPLESRVLDNSVAPPATEKASVGLAPRRIPAVLSHSPGGKPDETVNVTVSAAPEHQARTMTGATAPEADPRPEPPLRPPAKRGSALAADRRAGPVAADLPAASGRTGMLVNGPDIPAPRRAARPESGPQPAPASPDRGTASSRPAPDPAMGRPVMPPVLHRLAAPAETAAGKTGWPESAPDDAPSTSTALSARRPVGRSAIASSEAVPGQNQPGLSRLAVTGAGFVAKAGETPGPTTSDMRERKDPPLRPGPPLSAAWSAPAASPSPLARASAPVPAHSARAHSAPEPSEQRLPDSALAPQVQDGRAPSDDPSVDMAALPRRETAAAIARQIAEVAMRMPDRTMEIRLDPQELGRVRLGLSIQDGAILVHLDAARADTMDLMRRHIDLLAQEFRAMGYSSVTWSFGDGARDGAAGDHAGHARSAAPGSGDKNPITAPAQADAGAATVRGARPDGLDIRL